MRCTAALAAVLAGLTFLPPAPSSAQGAAHAARVEVLFGPHDDIEAAIVRLLRDARHSIHVQAYLLTSREIAAALLAARARGVEVAVLADYEQTARAENSRIPELAAAGIPVALEVHYAAAHNKVILVDAQTPGGAVLTGSYNFTWSARQHNAENVLILRDSPAVLGAYLDNWRRHRAQALPYDLAFPRGQ